MSSKELITFINPVTRLGNKKYSYFTPAVTTFIAFIIIEIYAFFIVKDPLAVGMPAIISAFVSTIYFAFRDGIRGGIIASLLSVLYYFYIIYSRHYVGDQLESGIQVSLFLGVIYLAIGYLIGWLRQRVDNLIEREANEKIRLQSILQQLPVGVLITNNKGKIEYINKQLDLIVGNKIAVGKKLASQYSTVYSTITRVINNKKTLSNKEFVIERADKRKFYIRINASPIFDKNGKFMAAASIVDDITNDREMELRKDDFINMASHELKTPMTSMNLYISSLEDKVKSNRNKKLNYVVSNMKIQIDRLQRIINELLDVSRIQTGKLAFSKDYFRLDQMLEETIGMLQETTKQKIIFSKRGPIKINADRFRIYQVVTNLLSNAIKYSGRKGDIVISLKRAKKDAIVSVSDLGIGISKENQIKIFDKLYQVGDSVEKTYPGFGMGLYIAKEIIKRHKGKIWVESEKEKGSTFYFSLPLK